VPTDPRAPVIVGIGRSPGPIAPDLSTLDHHRISLFEALADAGLPKASIDGYFCGGGGVATGFVSDDAPAMAEYLGIQHRYLDGTSLGGASYIFHLQHASAAIRTGMCDVAAITYGSDRYSVSGRALGTGAVAGAGAAVAVSDILEAPYGPTVVSLYALIAQRYMHEYGVTSEMLAAVAVTARKHAALNPAAMYRDPISVEDVIGSPMIADPLHRLDCCVVSDGGGAVIVTTAERARDLDCVPVHVLGAAGGQTHWSISQMPDLTRSAAVEAGSRALEQAGRTIPDIDVLQLYDSFTITVLRLFEDLGFCGPGEAGAIAAAGELRLEGRFPCNTDGGGLSATHPGRRGIFLIMEAVRQLRGAAGAAQVADCRTAMVGGSGGIMSCIAAAVLGRDAA
jgi:acetyl-CoA acetyltransferase